jgi:hypothetical protein
MLFKLKLKLLFSIFVVANLTYFIIFTAYFYNDKKEDFENTRKISKYMKELLVLNNLVHKLQVERGKVAVYLNSTEKRTTDLKLAIEKTNLVINKFQSLKIDTYTELQKTRYSQIKTFLLELKNKRNLVISKKISSIGILKFYTDNIGLMLKELNLTNYSTDENIKNKISLLVDLIQIKELLGQQRALVSSVIGKHINYKTKLLLEINSANVNFYNNDLYSMLLIKDEFNIKELKRTNEYRKTQSIKNSTIGT